MPRLRWKPCRLSLLTLALILLSPLLIAAQNPPADQKTTNPPSPPEKKESTPQKPPEKKTEEPAPAPGQLKLESPEAPQAPPAKPAGQPQTPPQKLELETPKTEPAGGQKLETPVAPAQPPAEEHKPTIEGAPIFRGNRRIPAATLRARIFTHAGDIYDESALDRDFMALWNTGFFDDIRLEVADAPDGNKIITFYVREKKLVRSIDYKGLSTVQQSDVLDEFKKQKVGLSIQSQYDPVTIKHAEVVLQGLLAAHGKMFATVRHRTRNIPPNSVALTFIVVEGPKVKVGNVRFEGNTVYTDRQLSAP